MKCPEFAPAGFSLPPRAGKRAQLLLTLPLPPPMFVFLSTNP
jgi:hypothetical protein